jgi:paired amphipathic helix protein Sin3a
MQQNPTTGSTPTAQSASRPTTTPTNVQTPAPANTNTGSGNQYRQVKFENALDFLDQVKLQFANQPKVYNQFLDIMKDFKAQCIDTPGVIARVSELFKGHRNLILGFNTFLPPGYKIEKVPGEDDEMGSGTADHAPMNEEYHQPQHPHTHPTAPSMQLPSSSTLLHQQPPPANQPIVNPQMTSAPIAAAASVTQQQRKQPEFDHARNYVKKIKMRFALQPHIYKAFLEILHTYHKEQHTIKDVYEQVAALFHTHQDLLEEFTQFLPDPMAAQPPTATQPRPKKVAGRKTKEKVAEKGPTAGDNLQRQISQPQYDRKEGPVYAQQTAVGDKREKHHEGAKHHHESKYQWIFVF